MRRLALLATLGLAGGAAAAPPAPGHGAVAVEAVLEGPSLDVTLRAPLETLLGFAREPRSEAEKRAAQALLERLPESLRELLLLRVTDLMKRQDLLPPVPEQP